MLYLNHDKKFQKICCKSTDVIACVTPRNIAIMFLSSNEKYKLSENIFTKPNLKSKKNIQFEDVITTSCDVIISKCLYPKNSKKMYSAAQKSKLYDIQVFF